MSISKSHLFCWNSKTRNLDQFLLVCVCVCVYFKYLSQISLLVIGETTQASSCKSMKPDLNSWSRIGTEERKTIWHSSRWIYCYIFDNIEPSLFKKMYMNLLGVSYGHGYLCLILRYNSKEVLHVISLSKLSQPQSRWCEINISFSFFIVKNWFVSLLFFRVHMDLNVLLQWEVGEKFNLFSVFPKVWTYFKCNNNN